MRKRKSAGVKLLGVLVLAVGGFALATVITGVGFATDTPSSSSSSSSTDTTTTTPPTTSTTTTPGEGCTPGYWKQPQHLDSWPATVNPDMLVSDIFTGAGTSGSATLLEALSFKGGPTVQDAKDILLRQAVAAYLNSLTINYPLTTTEVVNQVNAALASGDRSTILALEGTLDSNNNLGCPLN